MIKFAVFGEFFENWEDNCAVTLHLHIFFSAPQNDLKKIAHRYHDGIYLWKRN